MTRHFLPYIIFLLVSSVAMGQTPTVADSLAKPTPPTTSAVLYVYGYAITNSNSFTGKMASAFIKGGYIDEATKNTTLNRIKEKNRLGLVANYGATFVKFSKQRKGNYLGYYLRYNEGFYFGAKYNADAFRLMFYGNKQFEGQTVTLSPLHFNLLGQRSLGGGAMLGKGKNTFWLGADFVQGTQYTNVTANNLSFTTSTGANDLTLAGDFSVKQSTFPQYKAGYGFALNGQWFTNVKEKVYLSFTVDNVGMVFWGNNPTNFSRDTTLSFSGLSLNEALESDSAWSDIQDSLSKAILPTERTKAFNTVLPFYVSASASKYVKKFQFVLNVNYRYLPGYIPQGAFRAAYMGKHIIPSVTVMYGGFGGFNTGIGVGFVFGKGYSLYIDSMLNEGWIAANKASGLGVGVKFYKSFYYKNK